MYFIYKSVKFIICRTTYNMTIHMISVAKVDYRGAAATKKDFLAIRLYEKLCSFAVGNILLEINK